MAPLARILSRYQTRALRLTLALALLAWLGLNLWSLEGYPPPYCDEAFYSRSAARFVEVLSAGRPWPDQAARVFYMPYGRSYWLVVGGAFALLGKSLFAARLVSLLGWALTVAATWWLARRYATSQQVAGWSAGILAVAWIALLAGRTARPDIWAVAVSTFALGLAHCALERRSAWLFGLLGLTLVFGLEFHPIAVYTAIPLTIWVGLSLLRRRAYGHLVSFLGVLLLAGLGLAVLRLGTALGSLLRLALADPGRFLASYVSDSAAPSPGLGITLLHAARWFAIDFWWHFYAWLTPVLSLPQAALFLLGLLTALLRGRSDLRVLALVTLLSSALFALVNHTFTAPPGYALLWLPLYVVMGVDSLLWLGQRLGRWEQLTTLALGGLIALFIAGDIYLIAKYPPATYRREARLLTGDMPPGARVLTSRQWWYALPPPDLVFLDETLLAPVYSTLWWNAVPDASELDASTIRLNVSNEVVPSEAARLVRTLLSEELRPDYVIDDGLSGCHVVSTPLAEALTAYVEQTCTLTRTVTLTLYDQEQRVYACRWP